MLRTYKVAGLQGHRVTRLHGHRVPSGCRVAGVAKVTRLQGYAVVGLRCYRVRG